MCEIKNGKGDFHPRQNLEALFAAHSETSSVVTPWAKRSSWGKKKTTGRYLH